MATFQYTSIRQMEPRPGVKYATRYYKQTPREYQRLTDHVKATLILLGETALSINSQDLYAPLQGFPRSGRQANYSALDIITDLLAQLQGGKDVPQAMIDRWQRLFQEFPEINITLEPATNEKPQTVHQALFE